MEKIKEILKSCQSVAQVQMVKRYVRLLTKDQPLLKQRTVNAILADSDWRWNIESN